MMRPVLVKKNYINSIQRFMSMRSGMRTASRAANTKKGWSEKPLFPRFTQHSVNIFRLHQFFLADL